ncbi:MAG: AAA family ATPase, partial [Candidatus Thermoplasmatota archaeon]|nr:AAA family ATPase [Candidatus Thermoplasmatota archaeon]
MLFKSFTIKNFKGIKELTIDLDKSPNSNIYPLVGLNESGKTTILEAISNFDPNPEIGPSDNQTTTLQKNPNAFLPLNERANFNGYISIGATLRFEEEDIKYINSALKKETPYSEIKRVSQTEYSRQYNFQDSNHSGTQRFWTGLSARKPTD